MGIRPLKVVERSSFPIWWWIYRALGKALSPILHLLPRDSFNEGRLGRFKDLPQGGIWIHAVSVGEVGAAESLVEAFLNAGEDKILITVGTRAGWKVAKARFQREGLFVAVAPFDVAHAVGSFLEQTMPKAALFVETELWPVMMGSCREKEIPLFWVNGRVSDRMWATPWPFRGVVGWMIRQFRLRLMRGLEDLDRAKQLAGDGRGLCLGDLKFDKKLPTTIIDSDDWGPMERVLVAGSTHEGEEEMILGAFGRLRKDGDLRLVIAPRQVDRADWVADIAAEFKVVRWSEGCQSDWDVLIVDEIGVLAGLYRWATIALVGGSWIPRGGHNPLEPASMGIPTLFGPYMDNFRNVAGELLGHGAARSVDREDLIVALKGWLDHPDEAAQAGRLGPWIVKVRSGAARRMVSEVLGSVPRLLSE